MFFNEKVLKFGGVLGMALMLSACGGNVNSILKDAKLELKQDNGQQVLALTTEINTANIALSAVTLPIHDNQNRDLGKVEIFTDVTTNKSYLAVTFNYQTALGIPSPALSSMLPNGTAIPLTGIDMTKMMAYDIGFAGSKLYLYYDSATKKAVIGVAVNIPSLAIGQTANLFSNFSFNSVSGLAGLYLGQAAGTSGVGIFTDLSAVAFPNSSVVIRSEMAKSEAGVGFTPMSLTAEQQSKLDYRLYELSVSGQPVTAQ